MGSRYKRALIYVVILAFTAYGCKDKVVLPDQPLSNYIQVYMPQAVNGPVTYNFSTADTVAPSIIYGANYGGFGYPDQDVPLSFEVDPAVADSFNTANSTDYALLPAKSYTLGSTSAVIKKGELSTEPLRVTLNITGDNAPGDISKTYILPVSLKDASVKISPALQTYYCLINIVPVLFDRTDWKIVDFSSEEASGEGPNNGRAVFALDGNNNTFWHSQWKNGAPAPPHYITIDMGQSKRILGSAVVDRQNVNSGRPEHVELFVSTNGTDWSVAYAGDLLNIGEMQKMFFSQAVTARYVKFQVDAAFGSSVTNLAEFYLF